MSYEEYEESWDLEDQSKKCKRAVNCLLASCDCRGERGPIREEEGNLLVDLPESGETETGGRAGTDTATLHAWAAGTRAGTATQPRARVQLKPRVTQIIHRAQLLS